MLNKMCDNLRNAINNLNYDPSYLNYMSLNNAINNEKSLNESRGITKIAILRNFTIEPIIPILKSELFMSGFNVDFYISDYDTIAKSVLNSESSFFDFSPDIIFLSQWIDLLSEKISTSIFRMSYEERKNEADRIFEQHLLFLKAIRNKTNAPIIFNNFPLPEFTTLGIIDQQNILSERDWYIKLNKRLQNLTKLISDTYCFNLEMIFNIVGIKNSFDKKKFESVKSPFTFSVMGPIAKEFTKFLRALMGKTIKCLVLDCDNTLWGGIIGEDGLDGIKIGGGYPGSSFVLFQQQILNFKHRGIILALSTKNNEEDVINVFKNHPMMILKLSDITIIKANWDDKAANVSQIANELNIGLDSIVFVDDSKFECEWVSSKLPEVKVIHLNEEPCFHINKLLDRGYFDSLTYLEEDNKKTERYKAEVLRKKLIKGSNTYEDYLKSLNLEVIIQKATNQSLERVAQLTQKTNQFNLSTKRYTLGQIDKMFKSNNYSIYTISANDNIADLGIIGAAIIFHDKNKSVVDSFMMSCRALGRGLEFAFLTYIIEELRLKEENIVEGIFIPTKKNQQTETFYQKNNFIIIKQSEEITTWKFNMLENKLNPYPKWIKLNSKKIKS